jgi:DeoR family transcriptional regulator, glycerol-3-phosphate regulon repressor
VLQLQRDFLHSHKIEYCRAPQSLLTNAARRGTTQGAAIRNKKKPVLALSFRQSEILELARAEGRVVVEDLAQRFDVTLQTIRRDLSDLADAGHLDRVHGGAVVRTGVANIGYEARRRMNEAAKTAIARACAAAIPDNCSLILNLGTTTEAVARELLHHRNITVITNNMNVANTLVANPGCEVVVAGGALRRTDGGLVGELTTQFFEQFKVDYAVIGVSALDRDGDLLDFDLAEVRVSKAIIHQSREVHLVCDHSKLDRSAPARLASLAEITRMFTDRPLPADLARKCEGWGTVVQVAEAG